jgi:multiple sugar transport system permease protein
MNFKLIRLFKTKINRINPGYFFIAPAIILIGLMTIFPTYKVIEMSFHKLNRRTQEVSYVGLNNFQDVVNDKHFHTAMKQTMIFTGWGVLGHMGLGLILALFLNSNLNNSVSSVCRSLILLPWVISPPVVAILSQLWGHPLISPIGKILASFGWSGNFMPLGSVEYALPTIIIINIWQFTPFYMLMILANLQTIDEELYSAAMVDGANYFQKIRFITLPHIKNVLLTFTLFSMVVNAAYFDLIWIATQGGPIRVTEILATYTYRLAFQSLDWNKASVVGIALLLLSLLLALITLFFMREKKGDV